MAGTLSQAKQMFQSIDSKNTGLILRDELKNLMQEIGGSFWATENFDTMLEACGVAPGSGEVNYGAFLERLLSGEDEKKPEAPKEAEKDEALKAEKPSPAVEGAPSAQDVADAQALVGAVCARVVVSMKELAKKEKQEDAQVTRVRVVNLAGETIADSIRGPVSAEEVLQSVRASVANRGRFAVLQQGIRNLVPTDVIGKGCDEDLTLVWISVRSALELRLEKIPDARGELEAKLEQLTADAIRLEERVLEGLVCTLQADLLDLTEIEHEIRSHYVPLSLWNEFFDRLGPESMTDSVRQTVVFESLADKSALITYESLQKAFDAVWPEQDSADRTRMLTSPNPALGPRFRQGSPLDRLDFNKLISGCEKLKVCFERGQYPFRE